MPASSSLPDFTNWPSFPFEGDLRVKPLEPPVDVEPSRKGEDASDCTACAAPDDAYIWVSERWRVRAMDRPTGLPMVLILETRSHLDLGDLPNLLAAELGVMTVRLERAVRSLDGVARVHVNRWGDGSAHLHMWFLARPYGMLQLRGTFLSMWDDILPPITEERWRENLALVAAWLAEFGGRPLAEPPRIHWKAPSSLAAASAAAASAAPDDEVEASVAAVESPDDDLDAVPPATTGDARSTADNEPTDGAELDAESTAPPKTDGREVAAEHPTGPGASADASDADTSDADTSDAADVDASDAAAAPARRASDRPAPRRGRAAPTAAGDGDGADGSTAPHRVSVETAAS